MSLPLYQVDAFSALPFAGNPAAVCLLDSPRPDAWMLSLAQEMNLSETAFLLPEADGYNLRWFTPANEVGLCGHATLASAHILWETGRLLLSQEARFSSQSGLLTARKQGDWIELNFPARAVEAAPPPPGLLEALDVAPVFCGRSKNTYMLELASEAELRRVSPDFARLKTVEARAVAITCASQDPAFDYQVRFFNPRSKIDEDPVTGSAETYLTPYWADKLGKLALTAFQASARGGVLRLRLLRDPTGERVGIAGQAITIFKGDLFA